MALTEFALNTMADALAGSITELSLHSADPGTTGANETSAGREVPTFSAAANGDFNLTATLNFTGGAASGACTHVGAWAGASFVGGAALTGDQNFNAAGEYNVDSFTVNGAAA